jgi:hypothetical protein
MWNANDDAWEELAGDGSDPVFTNVTASGTLDVTGASTLTGGVVASSTLNVGGAVTADANVTIGDAATVATATQTDLLTINALQTRNVYYEDFSTACAIGVEASNANPPTTDAAVTKMMCPNLAWNLLHRNEQVNTITTRGTYGGNWDVSGDVTANDGMSAIFWPSAWNGPIEVATTPAYFHQIDITIGDISAVDGDFFFGIRRAANWQAAGLPDPVSGGWFTLSDNAGDLDVECQNASGGIDNNDTGITWADSETKTLTVVMDAAGGYVFYVDGVIEPAANCDAAGSHEADDGFVMHGFFHYTQGAEGAATGIALDNLKMGPVAQ